MATSSGFFLPRHSGRRERVELGRHHQAGHNPHGGLLHRINMSIADLLGCPPQSQKNIRDASSKSIVIFLSERSDEKFCKYFREFSRKQVLEISYGRI